MNKIIKQKNPGSIKNRGSGKVGGDLLSHITAVPSALAGLTSLFGMGRGGTPPLKPPKSFQTIGLNKV